MGFDFAALRSSFFDRSAVTDAVSAAKKKGLSKAGAFVRQRARTSIRRRKKSAEPGKPPSAHGGQIKLIFFAWDAAAETVVVGPAIFAAARGPKRGMTLLETGGQAQIKDGKGRPKRVRYAGNPFMGPAVRAELPKFPGVMAGAGG
jgi:hypothetical protein